MLNTFIPRVERKVYLSRRQTRASMEPIGDPFGGVAYGKREEPISAAFAAVAAGAASAAAWGTVIATVGVGATVVGAITGSKSLMKIGGVLGLVGGVVSLGASAGLFGETAAAASGEIAGAASGNIAAAEATNAATVEALNGLSEVGSGIGNSATGGLLQSSTSSFAPLSNEAGSIFSSTADATAGATASGATPSTAIQAGAVETGMQSAPGAAVQSAGEAVLRTPTASTVGLNAPGVTAPAAGGSVYQSPFGSSANTGWLDKMMNSDRVVEGALKLGGNTVQGFAQGQSAAEQLTWKEKQDALARGRASAAGRLYSGLLSA